MKWRGFEDMDISRVKFKYDIIILHSHDFLVLQNDVFYSYFYFTFYASWNTYANVDAARELSCNIFSGSVAVIHAMIICYYNHVVLCRLVRCNPYNFQLQWSDKYLLRYGISNCMPTLCVIQIGWSLTWLGHYSEKLDPLWERIMGLFQVYNT